MKTYYDSEKKIVASESSKEAFVALLFNGLISNPTEEMAVARLERLVDDCEDPKKTDGYQFSIPLLQWAVGFLRDIENRAASDNEYASGAHERFIFNRVLVCINKLKHSVARCHPDLIVVQPSAEPYRPAGNVTLVAVTS